MVLRVLWRRGNGNRGRLKRGMDGIGVGLGCGGMVMRAGAGLG